MSESANQEQVSKSRESQHSRTDKRFDITKTGMIGTQRDTMLHNELHFLPQLGRGRTRGHQLPPGEFVYGQTYDKLDGGVPEAMVNWARLAKDSKTKEERFKLIRDFIALNKAAAKSGCVNTKQNDQFRAINDIKRKVRIGGDETYGPNNYENGINRSKMTFPPEHTFGLQNRPSTPLHEVLEHRYLYDWLEDMQGQQAQRVAVQKQASKAISGAYHTKSSWLKNAKIPVEEKPLWKMTRFRNVEAAVDSFRSDLERKRALCSHSMDCIPREGVNAFKEGVYTVNTTSLPC